MGIYQHEISADAREMTVFDDFEPYTFSWTGSKAFSDYTNGFAFAFNNDADGKAGSLTVRDISTFQSRVLTVSGE